MTLPAVIQLLLYLDSNSSLNNIWSAAGNEKSHKTKTQNRYHTPQGDHFSLKIDTCDQGIRKCSQELQPFHSI